MIVLQFQTKCHWFDLKIIPKFPVLAWLIQQTEIDEIEDVTDEMLEKLINNNREIAVIFCKNPLRRLMTLPTVLTLPSDFIFTFICLVL